ncbi:hypothetical protein F4778DRAFT_799392 [Xylariomycetidae sp. FL2044]|nr:hypothetical protein F4778DRAFT_799392 [Xylariomycetidae sp. FL2044]
MAQQRIPTFTCDKFGYLIQSNSLLRVDIANGGAPTAIGQVGDGRNINAMGYNIGDNYMYAVIGNVLPVSLIRIGTDGNSSVLNSLNLNVLIDSGDVDENYQYWGTAAGKYWVRIDLTPGSASFGKIQASGGPSNGFTNTVFDWAFVPNTNTNTTGGNNNNNNSLYALSTATFLTAPMQRTVLVRFDRGTGQWSTVTDFGDVVGMNAWGAVWSSKDGYVYGLENSSGTVVKFPLSGKSYIIMSKASSSTMNDGARCLNAPNV